MKSFNYYYKVFLVLVKYEISFRKFTKEFFCFNSLIEISLCLTSKFKTAAVFLLKFISVDIIQF